VQKVRSLASAEWGCSTNFEAAYDLILGVAKRHKLAYEDMPALIAFTDMQFDEAAEFQGGENSLATMHDVIGAKTKVVAEELGWDNRDPSPIVYWNLSNTGGHHTDKDTEGTVMLSGFSPSLLELVMQGEALSDQEIEIVQADGTVVTEKVRGSPREEQSPPTLHYTGRS
jgi:hypothetical protein